MRNPAFHPLLLPQDEAPLLNPNVLICSVGTEIFYRTADGTLVPDQAWQAYLDQGWDRAAVEAVAAKFPPLKQQVRLGCHSSSSDSSMLAWLIG